MFVTFAQNNSGGYLIQNEDVDSYVIIEGDSLIEILSKANKIFMNYREYCQCCGERWDDSWKDKNDLKVEPMIYGESVNEFEGLFSNEKAIIYRKDGKKENVRFDK